MKKVENITSGIERAFYGSKDIFFKSIIINGEEDGESAFKECQNISVENSSFYLRYPFWHDINCKVVNATMFDTCRAAFWYDENLEIINCNSRGIKAVRECNNVTILNSNFDSQEFGWKSNRILVKESIINSQYAFFNSNDVVIDNVDFTGKYSFQYITNLTITNSKLDTKDAFWHCKHVVIKNCVVKGEYLAWYSEDITFDHCKIIGTQPLCYVKKLKLIDCEFEDCDLAFEYSEVEGSIIGSIDSIKNPLSGHLLIDNIPKMIIDDYDKSCGRFCIHTK